MTRDNGTTSGGGRDRSSGNSRGPSKGGNSGSGVTKSTPIDQKFTLQSDGRMQATFSTVLDRIANAIQQSFEHGQTVADSIINLRLEVLVRPRLRAPTVGADAEIAAIETMENKIEFTTDMQIYKKTLQLFQFNLSKAYALIYSGYCDKKMQNRIDHKINLDATINNDPIKLLITIRALMQEPIKEQDPMWSLIKSLIKSMSITQQDNETMTEYTKRFKQNRDFMKGLIGGRLVDHWVESQPEYIALAGTATQVQDQEEMKETTFARMSASLMMHSAKASKYGSLVEGLDTQYNLGNDQWPKTTDAAAKLLSNHKLDTTSGDNRKSLAQPRAATFAQKTRDTSNLICQLLWCQGTH